MADILQIIDLAVARLARSLHCIYLNHRALPDLSRHRGPRRYLTPTGSYACRQWKAGEDIHLVCMGDNSSYTFWDVVEECVPGSRITDTPPKDCLDLPMRALLTPKTEDELSSFQASLGSTKFFLHYCLTPALFPLPTAPRPAIPEYPSTYRNESHKDALQRVQDAQLAVAFSPFADPDATTQPEETGQPSTLSTKHDPFDLPVPSIAPSPTFSRSHDAINRLKWDPQHQPIEYEIGYLDRFEGIMWLPLREWGRAAIEDEDFIPEHRVWLIKRSVSQVLVWDRKQKRDWTHVVW